MIIRNFQESLYMIQGKTVAVVYIFEGEDIEGYEHYDIWQSDVICEWLNAIHLNHCYPLILDVRTFIQKAMNNTLPHIDFVLNLNAGNKKLSTLGLIPSVCSFLNIPCIPCNTVSIIAGEHKNIANYVANATNLNLPKFNPSTGERIFRPINYGSSRGVIKGMLNNCAKEGVCQEFIQGYDITTPILYNPIAGKLQALPTVMYYSNDKDINWFFNEEVKEKRDGYKKQILKIDPLTEEQYINLSEKLSINCYCRIDARVKCGSKDEWKELCSRPIPSEKIYFIEINPMPTLKQNINIHNAINALYEGHPFYNCYTEYKSLYKTSSPTGFILFCSMLANLEPSIEKKRI